MFSFNDFVHELKDVFFVFFFCLRMSVDTNTWRAAIGFLGMLVWVNQIFIWLNASGAFYIVS